MATFIENKFGDILVESNKTNKLPDNFTVNQEKKTIFKDYTTAPEGTELLCESETYGVLYATKATMDVHPFIDEHDYMTGGCMVVFVEKNNKLYVTLVKVKGRPYIMNPAGHRNIGESYEKCAIRETKEETNIDIPIENVKPLATWTFNTGFGGLKWIGKTKAFYGITKCPNGFNFDTGTEPTIDELPKTYFMDKNDEVDYLMFIEINKFKQLRDSGELNAINLNGHHLGLINEAIHRIENTTTYSYLKSFNFDY